MPAWGDILKEINGQAPDPAAADNVRRKYLTLLHHHTKRDIILYASNWTKPISFGGAESINEEDKQGLMEAVHGLKSGELDLILHSPDGVAEVTESMVSYLRKKFDNIRVIVPQAAMSAATMLACAANEIVMGKQSLLGPIDPQLGLLNEYGVQLLPAQAIIDNFETAKKISSESPQQMGAFLPIFGTVSPGLDRAVLRGAGAFSRASLKMAETVHVWRQKRICWKSTTDCDALGKPLQIQESY